MLRIIGSPNCGQCEMVKRALTNQGVDFTYSLFSEVEDGQDLIDKAIKEGFANFPIILGGDNFMTVSEVIND